MPPSVAAVVAKARAYVEALAKLPRSASASPPHGHFARDYNTLRQLALEAAPGLDERLLGRFVQVQERGSSEISDASYVEIEVYARQIYEQMLLLQQPDASRLMVSAPGPNTGMVGAYSVAALRRDHSQAYAPWTSEDDDHLTTRFLDGAEVADLAEEFGRKPSAIQSRLSKLGLSKPATNRRAESSR